MSDALETLRGLPMQQAVIYNRHHVEAARLRQDPGVPVPVKVERIAASAKRAIAQLVGLQEKANAAEQVLILNSQSGVAATAEYTEVCERRIKGALAAGATLPDVCALLVETGDRAGFTVLYGLLPWLALEKQLNIGAAGQATPANSRERAVQIQDARAVIQQFEQKLFTEKQQAALDERREAERGMPLVRDNFKKLFDYFGRQQSPNVVQGAFIRLEQLYAWVPVPGEERQAGGSFIRLLLDDRPESSPVAGAGGAIR